MSMKKITGGKMKKIFAAICILAIFASGCSTMINGKTQKITVNSNVKDAEITANGQLIGRTPFTGLIERNSNTTFTIRKEGYEAKSVTLDTAIEPVFWGNIIIGGVLGSTTDLATGAMYKYAPGTIQIDLEKTLPAGK